MKDTLEHASDILEAHWNLCGGWGKPPIIEIHRSHGLKIRAYSDAYMDLLEKLRNKKDTDGKDQL